MSSFCKCKSYSHFFSKNISVFSIFNDQSFNNMLTNDIVSFEQRGPGVLYLFQHKQFKTLRQWRVIMKGSVQWSTVMSWTLPLVGFELGNLPYEVNRANCWATSMLQPVFPYGTNVYFVVFVFCRKIFFLLTAEDIVITVATVYYIYH